MRFYSDVARGYIDVSDSNPLPVVVKPDGTYGAVPVTGAGGGTVEPGPDADWAVGREILVVEQSTDLTTVPDFLKYSYVDVRGTATDTEVVLNLPSAEAYGEGRILYVLDKLGRLDGEVWNSRIRLQASTGEGIDGNTNYSVVEAHGFVAIRATKTGPVAKNEWQVVAVNSPNHHASLGFGNWVTSNMEVGKGYLIRWGGAHVYVPLMIDVYPPHAVNKFWVRYYPTEAMANADKDRQYGTEAPATVQVMNEFVFGGDLPTTSYGNGGVVSSWLPDRKPVNIYFCVAQIIEGTPGRLSAYSSYKPMVTATS